MNEGILVVMMMMMMIISEMEAS
uniref:Uncharacterized protein n=1 Tax=Schistosoma haematobium TaxID=6185 RepID=A0A094ZUJ7_SCHHA